MLLHGTSEVGAPGTLKNGFKDSESGWFGEGSGSEWHSDKMTRSSNRHGASLWHGGSLWHSDKMFKLNFFSNFILYFFDKVYFLAFCSFSI